jgi:manganese transport protein
MGIAGLVNMSMLVIAAASSMTAACSDLDSIEEAHAQFGALAGGGAALAFAGRAARLRAWPPRAWGTYAGQVVMQGFIARTIPIVLRRLITMTPALIVLAIGLNRRARWSSRRSC